MGSIKSNACITVNNALACNWSHTFSLHTAFPFIEGILWYFTWDTAIFGIPLQFDPEVREGVVRAFSLWSTHNWEVSFVYKVNGKQYIMVALHQGDFYITNRPVDIAMQEFNYSQIVYRRCVRFSRFTCLFSWPFSERPSLGLSNQSFSSRLRW